MISIVIGGDVYPAGNIKSAFITGDAEAIFHDLLDDIRNADLAIANLEAPLVARPTPIPKPGGVLGGSSKAVKGFAAANWHVLNLANNHSFDHGSEGLFETMRTINEAGLAFVGAGSNIEEAGIPFVKEIKGQRIVVYSMAEREFSIADENTAGANPLDLINFVSAVNKYKQNGLFITLFHGSKEYYPYPTPEMVRRCRFMVDMGADAVICCHTHCPLPWETYRQRPIVYGLGNLVFEVLKPTLDSWYEGYLGRLSIENKEIRFEAIPYIQSKLAPGAQKMDGAQTKRFVDEMEIKSSLLKDSGFLKAQWDDFCERNKLEYLAMLFGYNKIMRKVHRLLIPLLHSKEDHLRALLLVQCETHREILNTIFKQKRQYKKRR